MENMEALQLEDKKGAKLMLASFILEVFFFIGFISFFILFLSGYVIQAFVFFIPTALSGIFYSELERKAIQNLYQGKLNLKKRKQYSIVSAILGLPFLIIAVLIPMNNPFYKSLLIGIVIFFLYRKVISVLQEDHTKYFKHLFTNLQLGHVFPFLITLWIASGFYLWKHQIWLFFFPLFILFLLIISIFKRKKLEGVEYIKLLYGHTPILRVLLISIILIFTGIIIYHVSRGIGVIDTHLREAYLFLQ